MSHLAWADERLLFRETPCQVGRMLNDVSHSADADHVGDVQDGRYPAPGASLSTGYRRTRPGGGAGRTIGQSSGGGAGELCETRGGNNPDRRRVQRRMGSHPTNMLGGIPIPPPILATSRTCQQKHILHSSVFPILNWFVGGIFWARMELKEVYSLQLQMTRKALGLWPCRDEDIPTYLRRTARWIETTHTARVLWWDLSVAASWWIYAGHLMRLAERGPSRWVSPGPLCGQLGVQALDGIDSALHAHMRWAPGGSWMS